MDEKYKIYCKTISDDLKNASRDNPKHFWKILGGHKRQAPKFKDQKKWSLAFWI
jgi:hypothetical protein